MDNHKMGNCGIRQPHTLADHRAHDLIRGIVRGRVFDPGTNRWYKDGYAPFQLNEPVVFSGGELVWNGRRLSDGAPSGNAIEAKFYPAMRRVSC